MFRFFPLCFKCWSALFFPSCRSFLLFLVVPVITKPAKGYIHILDCTSLWQGNLTPLSDIFLRSKRKYICENNTPFFHWNRIIFKFKGNFPHKHYKQNFRFLVWITMKRLISIVYCCSLWNCTTFIQILTVIVFLLLVWTFGSPAIYFQIVRTDFHVRYKVV